MGQNINEAGFFQSDKHPELKENQVILNFKDEYAQQALEVYAVHCEDQEFAQDIIAGINAVRNNGLTKKPD